MTKTKTKLKRDNRQRLKTNMKNLKQKMTIRKTCRQKC